MNYLPVTVESDIIFRENSWTRQFTFNDPSYLNGKSVHIAFWVGNRMYNELYQITPSGGDVVLSLTSDEVRALPAKFEYYLLIDDESICGGNVSVRMGTGNNTSGVTQITINGDHVTIIQIPGYSVLAGFTERAEAAAEGAEEDAEQTALDRVATGEDRSVVVTARNEAVAAKDLAVPAAETATTKAAEAAADRIQTGLDRIAVENLKEDRLGTYNAATGVYIVSETAATGTLVSTPAFAKGKYFDVTVEGTNSVTGTSRAWKIGDKVISAVTKWDARPFAIGDGTLSTSKVDTNFSRAILTVVEVFGLQVPIYMAPNGQMGLWADEAGVIHGKFSMTESTVPIGSLPVEVVNGVVGAVDMENANAFPIYMAPNGQMGIYADRDGSVHVPQLIINPKAIVETYLADAVVAKLLTASFKRYNETNLYDVDIDDDELIRGLEFEIPTKTSDLGYSFSQFPNTKTRGLKGNNNTGTDLLFKQISAPIRGRKVRGDFNPTTSGIVGTVFKGQYGNSYTNSYPAFPAGSTGDCWIIDCGNTAATKTANSLTFKNGDFLVKTAGGYDIQPGPGNGTYLTGMMTGEFWNITASGWFGGKYYTAGTKIYILGLMSQSGPKYIKYGRSKPGELFIMGECDGSFSAPGSPASGDAYIFSAAATTQGIAGVIGDLLVYYRSGWGLITAQAVTVANGKSFVLPCKNANEWSVRRSDKSNSIVTVTAYGTRTTVRRKTTDDLHLISDSMFGALGAVILTLTGRTGTVNAYGGGTSFDVLAMLKDWIQTTDPYAGRVHIMWHGQNNTGDLPQVKYASHAMAALVGSYQSRFVFWSVLGIRTVTFTGGRMVATTQEDAFNSTGAIWDIEQFYEAAYPKQYFSPRKALLEAATTRTGVPCALNPGMSESQVATTYGAVPFSFWFDYAGKPFTAANLTSLGYHSAAGLPTGGVDKNYYVRSGNGVVGNLIVNVAGTWTEYTWDAVHLSPEGRTAVSGKFNTFLTLHNI